jgi:bifunctional non-homologous end joining protein LigD
MCRAGQDVLEMTLTIHSGKHDVTITRPDKPLFADGTTKADLARYYDAVGEVMVSHIAGRPLNLERYPDGIDGPRFFQQKASGHFPDWIRRVEVAKEGGTVEHVVADEPATLVYLAGQAAITPHAWTSRADRIDRPDRLIVDLDPSDPSNDVRSAALDVGDVLRDLGLEPFAMTTGSRGYHVVVPIQRRADHATVVGFARDLAAVLADREPDRFTIEQRKAKRGDRILLDMQRNAYAHTAVAPYAVRARPGAPVATPLRWEELSDPETTPTAFTLRDVPRRLEEQGDPWARIDGSARALGAARRRLDALR